ncbi:MAG: hypothetical protein L6R39_002062 [Caloplaca ligustica]|nr:MAG: hypothetical protein L6R39_002062 [Caloplaca ligustica]
MSSTPAVIEQLHQISALPTPKAVYVIGACSVLAFVIQTLTGYFKLQAFKGPWLASFSKLWMMKHVYDGDMHVAVAGACEKYGPLARIGLNDLVTNDADLLRRMSAVKSPYTKSEWYSGTQFDRSMNHVFSERDEARHRDRRNRMAPGYSGAENPYLEGSVDDQLQGFTNLIRAKYTSTEMTVKRVDFARLSQYLALDIITDMAFGEPAGFLSEDGDLFRYLETMSEALPRFEWVSCLTWLNRLLQNPIVSYMVMPTAQDKTGVGHLMGIAKQVVARRSGSGRKPKQDMLGSYINHGLSEREAETEAVLNIMAGSDTTVTALRSIVLFIIGNPTVYRKLQHELDTAADNRLFTGHFVRDSEARDLPYLQACIKEGLRVFPPTVGLMQKTVPEEGDTYKGVRIPGGTKIGYCAWGLHRSKAVFGEDADVFRPERWLHVPDDRLLEMNRVVDLIFGSGKYMCLGKQIVFLELMKIVATLFRQYDISLLDPITPLRSRCANGLFLQTDMWVRIMDRTDDVPQKPIP